MAHVHLLDDDLINKIAAGEVVERPASVVKELVENAIDAGASQIDIELEEGGRSLISVRDNGSGMTPEDALLALKRHTTSKIDEIDDLFKVSTMGFRGEALASISSVSHFSIISQTKDAKEGVRIDFDQKSKPRSISNVGPVGTQVLVKDLFYNVPARQAFLRSSATEFSHCQEYLLSLALARPDIGFSLQHNNREIFRVERAAVKLERFWGAKVLQKRVQEILKKEDLSQIMYFSHEDKYGRVEGLASPPGMDRGSSKHMYSFVNHRWVKDKVLRYGILRGYHSHLLKARYPICLLYLQMDPSLVDVNVHPAKAEVRFQYTSEVQSIIAMALRETIRKGAWAKPDFLQPKNEAEDETEQESQTDYSQPKEKTVSATPKSAAIPGPDSGFDIQFSEESPRKLYDLSSSPASYKRSEASQPYESGATRVKRMSFSSAEDYRTKPPTQVKTKPQEVQKAPVKTNQDLAGLFDDAPRKESGIDLKRYQFLGTFARCYLLFDAGEKLLAVDQHAFHERILYERLLKDQKLLTTTQALLVPEVIELDASEYQLIEGEIDQLESLGVKLATLNDSKHVEVRSVPSILVNRDIEAFLFELIRVLGSGKGEHVVSDSMHQLLSTMACHAAVRAGEELEKDDLQVLLSQSEGVDFYQNCPHGRRVFKWWSKTEVEHWFDR